MMPPVPVSSVRPVSGVLPHLDGLRGVAVLFVLLYHARVGLDGGYVGVDVFLVLSGFLVTSLLLTERDEGGVSLTGFWLRRVRRLLPVSTLVVVSSACAGLLLLEPQRLARLAGDVLGVATFSANVRFLGTHGEYLGGLSLPSPLLHFWSLALEEQFYVLWPVFLVVVLRLARRAVSPERVLAVLAGIAAAASFAASVLLTADRPAFSYYLLPTRAWELLAGALLALCWGPFARLVTMSSSRVVARAVSALGVLGLAVLVYSAASFDSSTVFPGAAALLPVTGTLAVLAAGASSVSGRVLSVGVLRWLGVRSYGAYLWHWPLLVFAGASGYAGSLWTRLTLVGLAVVLADCSLRLLESPVRRSSWLAVSPVRTAFLGTGLTACLLATSLLVGGSAMSPVIGVSGAASPGAEPRSSAPPSAGLDSADGGDGNAGATSVVPSAAGEKVLLLGDSTLAPLRWFVDGTRGLDRWGTSVEFVIDAESCRRLSMRSCLGREKRVPDTAVEVLASRSAMGERFRFVVLMAGYHSTPEEFAGEFDAFVQAAAAHGVEKVFVLEYRESLAFPLDGSRGEVSVFAEFNEVLRRHASAPFDPDRPELVLLEWNSFSAGANDWFRADGIHVNLAGALSLGEFLARGVLAGIGLACGPSPVCAPAAEASPADEVLAAYEVRPTDEHCYEVGDLRSVECRLDKLR